MFGITRILPLMLLLASAPSAALAGDLREQSSLDVGTAGLTAVRVLNARGQVVLSPSNDGRLHLTALKLVRGNSKSEMAHLADQMRVDTRTDNGQFVVEVHYPSSQSIRIGFWDLFSDFEIPSAEIRLGLEVPASLEVQVRCASGDISSRELGSRQTLESTSGDIQVDAPGAAVALTSTSGDVTGDDLSASKIRTVSGDVQIRGIRGPLDAHSTSGDISVRDAADSILIGTVSGDVDVNQAPRGLEVGTTTGHVVADRVASRATVAASSGDVELTLAAPLSRAQVTTSSGDIHVALGPGVGGQIELRTSNGSLETRAEIQAGSLSRRVITGRVGQGSAVIQLRSASGDIHLSTGGRES